MVLFFMIPFGYNQGMDRIQLAGMIDQTLLSPAAPKDQVKQFCEEAAKYKFASVCVNPVHVMLAKEILGDTSVKVCTVIDFPLGAGGEKMKVAQALQSIEEGADELDFVVDLSLVKSHKWEELCNQLKSVQDSVSRVKKSVVTKLILETCVLTDDEIIESCKAAREAGFGFVKTSTGFYMAKDSEGKLLPNGATVHAVQLMRKTVGDAMGVKASGGIHTTEQALALIEAGANRIGASAGVKIVEGFCE